MQHVAGVLLLFKRVASADFTARQVRIIEILARRVAHTVQGVYEPATGLLTRSAFEQRALALLGEAPQGASVAWLPSARSDEPQKYLLFGTPAELSVRAADASAEVVRVAEGDDQAVYRALLQRISNTEFSPRLHILQTVDGTPTLSVRGPEDGYASATETYSSADITTDLSQISASGRTLILTPNAVDAGYVQVQWNTTQSAWQTSTLPFGHGQRVMAPVGLGDTHNFALHGDQLVRVEFRSWWFLRADPCGKRRGRPGARRWRSPARLPCDGRQVGQPQWQEGLDRRAVCQQRRRLGFATVFDALEHDAEEPHRRRPPASV